jgi:hypothetical protein
MTSVISSALLRSDKSFNELLRDVYDRYPAYATESVSNRS